MMKYKKETKAGVKWTTASAVFLAVSQLLKISILTRVLEKTDFGLIALVMVVIGFCNLFIDMGFSSAIINRQNITQKEYSSLYWINFIFSLLFYVVLLLLNPFVASFYNEPELAIILPIMGANLIISAIGRQFKTIRFKQLEFKFTSLVEISSELLSLILAIVLALKGFKIYSLIYSILIQYILSNVIYFASGIRRNKILFFLSYRSSKPFLKIGLFQVGGQVINYFGRDLDILIIGKFFGSELLGGYSLAKQLVFRPATLINPILTKVAAPVLATMQSNKDELKKSYLQLISIVSNINVLVYVLVILFAYPIVVVIYGKDYVSIVLLVQILSVYMLDRAIGNPVGSLLTATGRTDLDFYWNLIYLVIAPVFILVGVQFNLTAVALLQVLCSLLLFVPFWKIVIYTAIKADLKEYIGAITNFSYSIQLIKKYINRKSSV